MGETFRLQVPGGVLSIQDLRDLVGWAGASGASSLRLGDTQDVLVDGTKAVPVPSRFLTSPGSIQSSAFEKPGTNPWLSTGTWMDVLAALPDPGHLDVQLVTPGQGRFVRWGHLRFVAQRAVHRWQVLVRRPGSDRLVQVADADTSSLADLIAHAADLGPGTAFDPPPPPARAAGTTEGFVNGARDFSFVLSLGPDSMRLEHWRALSWMAGETGASRAWLTPDRTLFFEGIPAVHRPAWEAWLAASRQPEVRGSLDQAVVAAGWGEPALGVRAEVLAALRLRGKMPGSRILVADDGLNRGDGICGRPFPVLIRAADSWLFRSGDGQRSGEGSLAQVLEAIEEPPRPPQRLSPVAEPLPASQALSTAFRCRSCLTVYDERYGDPRQGQSAGTPFSALSSAWSCPVCGGPRDNFSPQEA